MCVRVVCAIWLPTVFLGIRDAPSRVVQYKLIKGAVSSVDACLWNV